MVAVGTLTSGAHVRAMRRRAAFEALSGKLQAAYERIQHLEAVVTAQQAVGRGEALFCDTDDELISRLAAIKPCLEEQRSIVLEVLLDLSVLGCSCLLMLQSTISPRTLGPLLPQRPGNIKGAASSRFTNHYFHLLHNNFCLDSSQLSYVLTLKL